MIYIPPFFLVSVFSGRYLVWIYYNTRLLLLQFIIDIFLCKMSLTFVIFITVFVKNIVFFEFFYGIIL